MDKVEENTDGKIFSPSDLDARLRYTPWNQLIHCHMVFC